MPLKLSDFLPVTAVVPGSPEDKHVEIDWVALFNKYEASRARTACSRYKKVRGDEPAQEYKETFYEDETYVKEESEASEEESECDSENDDQCPW